MIVHFFHICLFLPDFLWKFLLFLVFGNYFLRNFILFLFFEISFLHG